MAATPPWKVFSPSNEYLGSLTHAEDAAALVAIQGNGATIRFASHAKRDTLWTEGAEAFSAAESYDETARVLDERRRANWQRARREAEERARACAKRLVDDWQNEPEGIEAEPAWKQPGF